MKALFKFSVFLFIVAFNLLVVHPKVNAQNYAFDFYEGTFNFTAADNFNVAFFMSHFLNATNDHTTSIIPKGQAP